MTTKQFIKSAITSLLIGYATIALIKWDINISSFNMGERGSMIGFSFTAFILFAIQIHNKKI